MTWLGLDIGGAHLKAADGRGWARSVSFPLWRAPDRLAAAVAALLRDAPPTERVAVTMTGELCDCFGTKAEGVRHILAAVERSAGQRSPLAYLVDGRLVPIGVASDFPHLAAASNWHALATFASRFLEGSSGMVIDVGSTTSDIVPIQDGRPQPHGLCDTDRLIEGELVYTGVVRTPLCAVTRWLAWQGEMCPVAAEVFATTADAYVLLGELPEQPEADWTADGRPLTIEFARARLARMVCADAADFNDDDTILSAKRVYDRQRSLLGEALAQVSGDQRERFEGFVISGQGEFLARSVVEEMFPGRHIVSLHEALGATASACAPAHALAAVAHEAAVGE